MKILHCVLLAAAALMPASALAAEILGEKPTYLEAVTEGVPNAQAIGVRIWVPGLEEGFVPQGLTVAEGHVLVSSYRSTEPKVNTGPCRVYSIEASTGKLAGQFDIAPGTCTHAGGLAYLGNGMLMLADTRQIFRIDLKRALADGHAGNAMRGAVRIMGELRGSFGAFDGKDAWIGTWTKDAAKSRMFRLHPRFFDDNDGMTVNEEKSVESIRIPLESQGAAFDASGNVWVSVSDSRVGKLHRLDRAGAVQASYEMMPGIEDLGFDAAGRLWAVSESGTKKYLSWGTKFPFVFAMDMTKLK
ncbi:MAG TPA: hypothetical protein VEC19_08190 [Usitatibacter sp.]|nr:hypothetical protein [Usitatibacter sp.]